MIQMETLLNVADNSGAKTAKCIKVLGGSKRMSSNVGDIIVLAVQSIIPGAKVKKGEVVRGVIVRTKKEIHRENGSLVRFDDNAAVLLDAKREPIGTRIFGPVSREVRYSNFMKIVSLAPEVL